MSTDTADFLQGMAEAALEEAELDAVVDVEGDDETPVDPEAALEQLRHEPDRGGGAQGTRIGAR
jgi:hypothetical protein